MKLLRVSIGHGGQESSMMLTTAMHLNGGVHASMNDLNAMRRELHVLQETGHCFSSSKAGVRHNTS